MFSKEPGYESSGSSHPLCQYICSTLCAFMDTKVDDLHAMLGHKF